MKGHYQRRYLPARPIQELVLRKMGLGRTQGEVAKAAGMNVRELQRLLKTDRITISCADRWACGLGLHLSLLYRRNEWV